MSDAYIELSIILISGLFACWLASLLYIPNILLMLLAGFIVGPITGWVHPTALLGELLLPIVSISVAVILFEGGLSLRLRNVKKIGPTVTFLVIFSIFFGLLLGTFFLMHVLNFEKTFSLLLASILVITGPTVIIPLLQQLHIKEPVRSILQWEGILIDPIGAIASVLIFEALFISHHESLITSISIGIVMSLLIGFGVGLLAVQIIIQALKRFLIPEELQNPVILLMVVSAYTLSNYLQTDSGLVTATVMGLTLANQKKMSIIHVFKFKESLRVILIAFLFVTLTANINLAIVLTWWKEVLALILFLLFIVRPLVVWTSTFNSSYSWKEKLLMSVVAPRGIVSAAVASLFSLELVQLDYKGGENLVPIVFSVITGTVCISSIATFILAPYLKLSLTFEPGVLIIGANSFARAVGEGLSQKGFNPYFIDTNFWKVSQAKRIEGNVYHGSFISFQVENEDTLANIGSVLALTENDDINYLAMNHFSHYFDVEQLYQLHPEQEKIPKHLMGRAILSESIPHSELRNRIDEGAVVRSTKLTEEFTFKAWRDKNPDALALFIIPKGAPLVPIDRPDQFESVDKGSVLFLSHNNTKK